MWLVAALELIRLLAPSEPVVLSKEPVTIPLVSHDKALSKRLLDIARSPDRNVVLVLKGVEAEARPEASWEVYVEPGSHLVGVVALFDRGIRTEGPQTREPAEFLFVLDEAIGAAGKTDLQVRFVPTSGVVVDGQPQAVEVRSNVTIGEISLATEAANPPSS